MNLSFKRVIIIVVLFLAICFGILVFVKFSDFFKTMGDDDKHVSFGDTKMHRYPTISETATRTSSSSVQDSKIITPWDPSNIYHDLAYDDSSVSPIESINYRDFSEPGESVSTFWSDAYDTKMINEENNNKFLKKIKQSHSNYTASYDKYYNYQADMEIVQPENELLNDINERDFTKLKKKKIKDVFDEATKKISPKTKRPIGRVGTDKNSVTVYENESEMNGGPIKGTSSIFPSTSTVQYESVS